MSDIVKDLRLARDHRRSGPVTLDAAHLIAAEDEILAGHTRVRIRDDQIMILRQELKAAQDELSRYDPATEAVYAQRS